MSAPARRLGPLAVIAVCLASCGAQPAKTTAVLPAAAEPAFAPGQASRAAGRSVAVGISPEGIVVDGKTGLVVVAVRNPAQLVLLDARSARVVRRVSVLGAPRHLQLAGPGGPVLVPEEPANQLLELSLPSGQFHSIEVGAHPHDATANVGRLFVGNEFGQSISVIEGTRTLEKVRGFVQPGGLAAVGSDVAVVDVRGNSVSLIDARSLRIVGRLGAGAGPTHVVADRSGQLYVADTRGGAVFTYATRPRLRLLSRVALAGAPYGLAIDPSRHRLWVTLTAKNQLVELATGGASPRVIAVDTTGRQPNTVTVDRRSGRVFVANAGSGTVELIDPHQ